MALRLHVLAIIAVLAGPVHAAPDRDPVRLRVGTMAIDGSRYMADMIELGKDIERRTRGGVQLEWVSGGQLGEEAAMADTIARGKLDGGALSETGLAALVPAMAVWGLPGTFRTYEEADRATTALGDATREQFAAHELVFAMWADLGFTRVFAADPVATAGELVAAAAPWLGAPLDGKLTEAITGGTARAWGVPPLYMLAIGTAKVRVMTNLRYRYVVGGLVFGARAWDRLDEAQRTAVLDACRAAEPKVRERWRKETARGIAALEKAGVKTLAASADDIARFLDAAAALRARRAKELGVEPLAAKIAAAAAP